MKSGDFVSRARQAVLDNLQNPQFGVITLARLLGVSRSELYKRIRAAERKSASQFIREIRLEKASELIADGEYSISEIAFLVGFNSPTYFSTCFREYYGYSPSTASQNGSTGIHEEAPVTPGGRKWTIPLSIGALALLIAVFGIFGMDNRDGDSPGKNSVAVLKFDYLGTDSVKSPMARMLADEVLNSLSNLDMLKVVTASSSFQVDKSEPCTKIGNQLGVDYLVDGSLSNQGNQLKATVKLIDADTGYQLWSESFEENSEDFFELQEEISNRISSQLNRSAPLYAKQLLRQRKTTNMEALELYLNAVRKGRVRYEDSITQAIHLLEGAVDLDPYFAEAYAELVFLYGRWHYYGSLNREERDRMMDKYIGKAIELDPESPQVLFAKADYDYLRGNMLTDSTEIIAGFRRVLQMNPNDHRSNYRLHQVFRGIGKYHTAHGYLESAWRLDPLNFLYNNVLARDLFWKWDEKERAFRIILEENAKEQPSRGSIYFKALMLADQPGGGYLSGFKVLHEALKEQPFTYGFLFWGRLLALDLDLVPIAVKYARLNEVKFPDNPIYTYEPAYEVCIIEGRYQEAMDLTRIWLDDKGLDEEVGYANLARVYYLQGDYQKSREILLRHFSGLYQDIESGVMTTDGIQLSDLGPIKTYVEVLRGNGDHSKASYFADFLCSFYREHDRRIMWGKKLFPMDCYYMQNDIHGFLEFLNKSFFDPGHRLAIYSNLKSARFAAFEHYPEYQMLLKEIEDETHRMRAEVVAYLKAEGDWDPAWDDSLE